MTTRLDHHPGRRRVKRTFATLFATGILVVGLTACDDTETAVPDVATTVAPQAPAAAVTNDDLFLIVVEEDIPGAGAAHIDLAKSVCRAFDAGATLRQVFVTMLGATDHLTAEQLGTLVGAGIGAYCPEHTGLIEGGDPA